ncbi:hypothetical protein ABTL72_19110, partial [Acinetobacter baumannii]
PCQYIRYKGQYKCLHLSDFKAMQSIDFKIGFFGLFRDFFVKFFYRYGASPQTPHKGIIPL